LIGALAGINLPRDSYSIDGRLVRIEGGLDVEQLEARGGQAEFSARGNVGDPPDYAGTTLRIHAEGPNLAHFNHLIGAELPAEPFTLDGRFAQGNDAITLDGVSARVGGIDLRVDGSLKTAKGLTGSSLLVDAKGPDAARLRTLVGLHDLPAEAWSAVGGLDVLGSGLHFKGVSASVGSLHALADGHLGTARGLVGTDLQLHAEDTDLAHAMPIFRVQGFPEVPIRADGRLRVEDSGIRLDGATATAGDIEVAVDGLIGKPDLDGTNGHVSIRGPRLASIGPYIHLTGLPQAPFSLAGDVRVTGRRVNLGDVVVVIDSNHISVDGAIGKVRGLVGTDVTVDISGPDLGRAGRLAEDLTRIPDLPPKPFTLETRLSIDDAGYEIDGLRATLDKATAAVDGRVGSAPKMVGTDLDITASGPDALLFTALTGVAVPLAPFKVSGRIQRTNAAVLFDHFSVELGGHSATLHGSLGERPRLVGTELELSVSGPGTALIQELTGFQKLPDEPFSLTGHFEGTPEKFTAEGLDLVLGPSDLKGSIKVDIRGRPDITARLVSDQLHFEGILKPLRDGAPAESDGATAPKTALLISNEPIDFGWMQLADADVDITVGILQAPVERFHDVSVQAHLEDGRLEVRRLAMAGSRGGSGSGSLVLEPAGADYRADVELNVDGVKFEVAGVGSPDITTEPPLDFDVRLQLQGASPHELAASANGSITIVFGRGVMDNGVLDLISQDFLLTLLNAFNPFAKDSKATELQCALALFTFEDGLMTLDPMAAQSDKMTMLGEGKIDFTTEKLDFDWVTKPRKGIGLSASMLTNPYIKLGGTLAKPAIELKGAQAVASTGVAVATMGISLVLRGMLDRATAEKKVCETALEKIAERAGASSGKSLKRN